MSLPIKATLKRRDGFVGHQEIERLDEVLKILDFPPQENVSLSLDEIPTAANAIQRTFHLIRFKEVQQPKGLRHIVAVYEEV